MGVHLTKPDGGPMDQSSIIPLMVYQWAKIPAIFPTHGGPTLYTRRGGLNWGVDTYPRTPSEIKFVRA